MDTSESTEGIWNHQITSKNRNMIRKAERNGLVYNREDDYGSFDEFIGLYEDTMNRLNADDFYFFDRSYFNKMKNNLLGRSFLGTIRKEGKLICVAIFMYSGIYGHYHLQGNDRAYSSLGGGNYLLWKAACDMHDLGVIKFHLGEGVQPHWRTILYTSSRRHLAGCRIFIHWEGDIQHSCL